MRTITRMLVSRQAWPCPPEQYKAIVAKAPPDDDMDAGDGSPAIGHPGMGDMSGMAGASSAQ